MNTNNDSTPMVDRPGLISRIFSKKVFQRLCFVLLALITLGVLAYNFEAWRGRRALAAFVLEYEGKGERFDRDSVIPPAVPDDRNFAMIPLLKQLVFTNADAHSSTNFPFQAPLSLTKQDNSPMPNVSGWMRGNYINLGDWRDYFRSPAKVALNPLSQPESTPQKNAVVTNDFPKSAGPQTPAKDVLLALSRYETDFVQLENAIALPNVRYPLPYEKVDPTAFIGDIMPHLSQVKGMEATLVLRSCALLADGQSERAFTNTMAAIKLADGFATEPMLISLLIRISTQSMALQPVWEGIARHAWSEAQLAELQRILEKADMPSHYRLAIRGERNLFTTAIGHVALKPSSKGASPDADLNTPGPRLPKAMAYHSQVWMLRMYQTLLEFEPGKTDENKRRLENFLASMGRYNPYAIMTKMLAPALEKAMDKVQLSQSCVDLAALACALERYRLAHGQYPETLAALTPGFIAKIPLDLMTGKPTLYRRSEGGGAVLYSVGEDRKDDGGRLRPESKPGAARPKNESYDWVWQIPGI